MTESKMLTIDFRNLGGPVHSGRSKGELARKVFNLDEMDAQQKSVIVHVPDDTYSVTTSFFLGLFGKSVRQAGSREAFLSRYEFQAPRIFLDTFDTCISRVLQEHHALVRKGKKRF